jgi:hypothetical protein
MHEPAVASNTAACERAQGAIDTASGAVAGFALHASARAFTFVALVAWREPVLGGAALMLLALIGWVRWMLMSECVMGEPLTRAFVLTKVLRKAVCAGRFEHQQDSGERKTMQTTNNIGTMGTGSTNNGASSASGTSGSQASNKPSFKELLDQLTDYTKGSAGERLQKMILAKLGVSEDDLKKMSPEDREKIMQKVRELIKKEVEAQKQLEEMQKNNKIRVSV